MKKEFATFSGTVPALYDQYMGPLFFEPYAVDIAMRLKEPNIQKVLEIACGTGRVTRHIRQTIPSFWRKHYACTNGVLTEHDHRQRRWIFKLHQNILTM